jgi:hypothetical protein
MMDGLVCFNLPVYHKRRTPYVYLPVCRFFHHMVTTVTLDYIVTTAISDHIVATIALYTIVDFDTIVAFYRPLCGVKDTYGI